MRRADRQDAAGAPRFTLTVPSWVMPGTRPENRLFIADIADKDDTKTTGGVELLFYIYDDSARDGFMREPPAIRRLAGRIMFTARLPDRPDGSAAGAPRFTLTVPSWVMPGTRLENRLFIADIDGKDHTKTTGGVELLFYIYDDSARDGFMRELPATRRRAGRIMFTARLPDRTDGSAAGEPRFTPTVPSWVMPGARPENRLFIADIADKDDTKTTGGVELLFYIYDDSARDGFTRELPATRRLAGRFVFTAHLPERPDGSATGAPRFTLTVPSWVMPGAACRPTGAAIETARRSAYSLLRYFSQYFSKGACHKKNKLL